MYLKELIKKDNDKFLNSSRELFITPEYNPKKHFKDLTNSGYFRALLVLRHYVKAISDYYFGAELNAKNIDLFMMTPSVSSPMGPGSDSEAVPIKFGKLNTFLVDSSQFGFEPLLLNDMDKVYCYLPSMRGEDYDKRHLNQFFHCELEIKGGLDNLIPIIEDYTKRLAAVLLLMTNIIDSISEKPEVTREWLTKILETDKFPEISFDDAVEKLIKNDKKHLINFTDYGKDISSEGEIELMKIMGVKTPIWITNFDRDRVPFYQKPDSANPDKVINADLLFPPIIEGAFGGEVVGCGQRQDNVEEMYESISRQNLKADPYEWYIDLRRMDNYGVSSGFGMGIERFITWALAKDDIKDAIIYPRLKNVLTYP